MIPIRTEMAAHRTPSANYALLLLNALVYLLLAGGRSERSPGLREMLILDCAWPRLYQFFTYQFLHESLAHLGANLLFLWVFGNSVNAKMGHLPYLMFYLAGGVFAALVFSWDHDAQLVGASGAIAAVTAGYLVLFPRSRVLVMYFLILIGFIELPAMVLIGVKIILWDNIIEPRIHGPGQVAVSAHLGGYGFGFFCVLGMLLWRVIPRDQYDLLALWDRWGRRRAHRSVVAGAPRATDGVFRAEPAMAAALPAYARQEARVEQIRELRARIVGCLDRRDAGAAATLYEQLVELDATQCLSDRHQLTVARELYSGGRFAHAASAFEHYLTSYPRQPDGHEIRLLVGIVYARDLQQYPAAEKYLTESLAGLPEGERREQCLRWLDQVRQVLPRPVPHA